MLKVYQGDIKLVKKEIEIRPKFLNFLCALFLSLFYHMILILFQKGINTDSIHVDTFDSLFDFFTYFLSFCQ